MATEANIPIPDPITTGDYVKSTDCSNNETTEEAHLSKVECFTAPLEQEIVVMEESGVTCEREFSIERQCTENDSMVKQQQENEELENKESKSTTDKEQNVPEDSSMIHGGGNLDSHKKVVNSVKEKEDSLIDAEVLPVSSITVVNDTQMAANCDRQELLGQVVDNQNRSEGATGEKNEAASNDAIKKQIPKRIIDNVRDAAGGDEEDQDIFSTLAVKEDISTGCSAEQEHSSTSEVKCEAMIDSIAGSEGEISNVKEAGMEDVDQTERDDYPIKSDKQSFKVEASSLEDESEKTLDSSGKVEIHIEREEENESAAVSQIEQIYPSKPDQEDNEEIQSREVEEKTPSTKNICAKSNEEEKVIEKHETPLVSLPEEMHSPIPEPFSVAEEPKVVLNHESTCTHETRTGAEEAKPKHEGVESFPTDSESKEHETTLQTTSEAMEDLATDVPVIPVSSSTGLDDTEHETTLQTTSEAMEDLATDVPVIPVSSSTGIDDTEHEATLQTTSEAMEDLATDVPVIPVSSSTGIDDTGHETTLQTNSEAMEDLATDVPVITVSSSTGIDDTGHETTLQTTSEAMEDIATDVPVIPVSSSTGIDDTEHETTLQTTSEAMEDLATDVPVIPVSSSTGIDDTEHETTLQTTSEAKEDLATDVPVIPVSSSTGIDDTEHETTLQTTSEAKEDLATDVPVIPVSNSTGIDDTEHETTLQTTFDAMEDSATDVPVIPVSSSIGIDDTQERDYNHQKLLESIVGNQIQADGDFEQKSNVVELVKEERENNEPEKKSKSKDMDEGADEDNDNLEDEHFSLQYNSKTTDESVPQIEGESPNMEEVDLEDGVLTQRGIDSSEISNTPDVEEGENRKKLEEAGGNPSTEEAYCTSRKRESEQTHHQNKEKESQIQREVPSLVSPTEPILARKSDMETEHILSYEIEGNKPPEDNLCAETSEEGVDIQNHETRPQNPDIPPREYLPEEGHSLVLEPISMPEETGIMLSNERTGANETRTIKEEVNKHQDIASLPNTDESESNEDEKPLKTILVEHSGVSILDELAEEQPEALIGATYVKKRQQREAIERESNNKAITIPAAVCSKANLNENTTITKLSMQEKEPMEFPAANLSLDQTGRNEVGGQEQETTLKLDENESAAVSRTEQVYPSKPDQENVQLQSHEVEERTPSTKIISAESQEEGKIIEKHETPLESLEGKRRSLIPEPTSVAEEEPRVVLKNENTCKHETRPGEEEAKPKHEGVESVPTDSERNNHETTLQPTSEAMEDLATDVPVIPVSSITGIDVTQERDHSHQKLLESMVDNQTQSGGDFEQKSNVVELLASTVQAAHEKGVEEINQLKKERENSEPEKKSTSKDADEVADEDRDDLEDEHVSLEDNSKTMVEPVPQIEGESPNMEEVGLEDGVLTQRGSDSSEISNTPDVEEGENKKKLEEAGGDPSTEEAYCTSRKRESEQTHHQNEEKESQILIKVPSLVSPTEQILTRKSDMETEHILSYEIEGNKPPEDNQFAETSEEGKDIQNHETRPQNPDIPPREYLPEEGHSLVLEPISMPEETRIMLSNERTGANETRTIKEEANKHQEVASLPNTDESESNVDEKPLKTILVEHSGASVLDELAEVQPEVLIGATYVEKRQQAEATERESNKKDITVPAADKEPMELPATNLSLDQTGRNEVKGREQDQETTLEPDEVAMTDTGSNIAKADGEDTNKASQTSDIHIDKGKVDENIDIKKDSSGQEAISHSKDTIEDTVQDAEEDHDYLSTLANEDSRIVPKDNREIMNNSTTPMEGELPDKKELHLEDAIQSHRESDIFAKSDKHDVEAGEKKEISEELGGDPHPEKAHCASLDIKSEKALLDTSGQIETQIPTKEENDSAIACPTMQIFPVIPDEETYQCLSPEVKGEMPLMENTCIGPSEKDKVIEKHETPQHPPISPLETLQGHTQRTEPDSTVTEPSEGLNNQTASANEARTGEEEAYIKQERAESNPDTEESESQEHETPLETILAEDAEISALVEHEAAEPLKKVRDTYREYGQQEDAIEEDAIERESNDEEITVQPTVSSEDHLNEKATGTEIFMQDKTPAELPDTNLSGDQTGEYKVKQKEQATAGELNEQIEELKITATGGETEVETIADDKIKTDTRAEFLNAEEDTKTRVELMDQNSKIPTITGDAKESIVEAFSDVVGSMDDEVRESETATLMKDPNKSHFAKDDTEVKTLTDEEEKEEYTASENEKHMNKEFLEKFQSEPELRNIGPSSEAVEHQMKGNQDNVTDTLPATPAHEVNLDSPNYADKALCTEEKIDNFSPESILIEAQCGDFGLHSSSQMDKILMKEDTKSLPLWKEQSNENVFQGSSSVEQNTGYPKGITEIKMTDAPLKARAATTRPFQDNAIEEKMMQTGTSKNHFKEAGTSIDEKETKESFEENHRDLKEESIRYKGEYEDLGANSLTEKDETNAPRPDERLEAEQHQVDVNASGKTEAMSNGEDQNTQEQEAVDTKMCADILQENITEHEILQSDEKIEILVKEDREEHQMSEMCASAKDKSPTDKIFEYPVGDENDSQQIFQELAVESTKDKTMQDSEGLLVEVSTISSSVIDKDKKIEEAKDVANDIVEATTWPKYEEKTALAERELAIEQAEVNLDGDKTLTEYVQMKQNNEDLGKDRTKQKMPEESSINEEPLVKDITESSVNDERTQTFLSKHEALQAENMEDRPQHLDQELDSSNVNYEKSSGDDYKMEEEQHSAKVDTVNGVSSFVITEHEEAKENKNVNEIGDTAVLTRLEEQNTKAQKEATEQFEEILADDKNVSETIQSDETIQPFVKNDRTECTMYNESTSTKSEECHVNQTNESFVNAEMEKKEICQRYITSEARYEEKQEKSEASCSKYAIQTRAEAASSDMPSDSLPGMENEASLQPGKEEGLFRRKISEIENKDISAVTVETEKLQTEANFVIVNETDAEFTSTIKEAKSERNDQIQMASNTITKNQFSVEESAEKPPGDIWQLDKSDLTNKSVSVMENQIESQRSDTDIDTAMEGLEKPSYMDMTSEQVTITANVNLEHDKSVDLCEGSKSENIVTEKDEGEKVEKHSKERDEDSSNEEHEPSTIEKPVHEITAKCENPINKNDTEEKTYTWNLQAANSILETYIKLETQGSTNEGQDGDENAIMKDRVKTVESSNLANLKDLEAATGTNSSQLPENSLNVAQASNGTKITEDAVPEDAQSLKQDNNDSCEAIEKTTILHTEEEKSVTEEKDIAQDQQKEGSIMSPHVNLEDNTNEAKYSGESIHYECEGLNKNLKELSSPSSHHLSIHGNPEENSEIFEILSAAEPEEIKRGVPKNNGVTMEVSRGIEEKLRVEQLESGNLGEPKLEAQDQTVYQEHYVILENEKETDHMSTTDKTDEQQNSTRLSDRQEQISSVGFRYLEEENVNKVQVQAIEEEKMDYSFPTEINKKPLVEENGQKDIEIQVEHVAEYQDKQTENKATSLNEEIASVPDSEKTNTRCEPESSTREITKRTLEDGAGPLLIEVFKPVAKDAAHDTTAFSNENETHSDVLSHEVVRNNDSEQGGETSQKEKTLTKYKAKDSIENAGHSDQVSSHDRKGIDNDEGLGAEEFYVVPKPAELKAIRDKNLNKEEMQLPLFEDTGEIAEFQNTLEEDGIGFDQILLAKDNDDNVASGPQEVHTTVSEHDHTKLKARDSILFVDSAENKELELLSLEGTKETVQSDKFEDSSKESGESQEETIKERQGSEGRKEQAKFMPVDAAGNISLDSPKIDEEEEGDELNTDVPTAPTITEATEDVDSKPANKKSNLLSGVGSKVKHSISKVKKAITGKSTHPKSTSKK